MCVNGRFGVHFTLFLPANAEKMTVQGMKLPNYLKPLYRSNQVIIRRVQFLGSGEPKNDVEVMWLCVNVLTVGTFQ